jgi:hypothetical protein
VDTPLRCSDPSAVRGEAGSSSPDETTSHSTDVTPSHSTRSPKDGNQVAGYKLSKNDSQVAGYDKGMLGGVCSMQFPYVFLR